MKHISKRLFREIRGTLQTILLVVQMSPKKYRPLRPNNSKFVKLGLPFHLSPTSSELSSITTDGGRYKKVSEWFNLVQKGVQSFHTKIYNFHTTQGAAH